MTAHKTELSGILSAGSVERVQFLNEAPSSGHIILLVSKREVSYTYMHRNKIFPELTQ